MVVTLFSFSSIFCCPRVCLCSAVSFACVNPSVCACSQTLKVQLTSAETCEMQKSFFIVLEDPTWQQGDTSGRWT